MESKNNAEFKKTGENDSDEEQVQRNEEDKKVGSQSNTKAWNDDEDFDSDEGDDEFGLDSSKQTQKVIYQKNTDKTDLNDQENVRIYNLNHLLFIQQEGSYKNQRDNQYQGNLPEQKLHQYGRGKEDRRGNNRGQDRQRGGYGDQEGRGRGRGGRGRDDNRRGGHRQDRRSSKEIDQNQNDHPNQNQEFVQQNEYADSNQDMKFEKRRSNYNDNDNFGKRDSYNKKYDRGNRQRQGGYQEDGFQKRNSQRQKTQPNPNSNYRLYYVNDPRFFNTVIKLEEPPYEFKMNIFVNSVKNENLDQEQVENQIQEICKIMQEKLKKFDVEKLQEYPQKSDDGTKDKLKYIFEINKREQAQECYNFFSSHDQNRRTKGNDENQYEFLRNEIIKIYLQKDEQLFEQYADDEAALYYQALKMEEELFKKQKEEQRLKHQQERERKTKERQETQEQRDKEKKDLEERKNGNKTAKEAEEETGLKFRNEPPKFQNKKKQIEQEQKQNQIDDSSQNREVIETKPKKDLRKIIDQENLKSGNSENQKNTRQIQNDEGAHHQQQKYKQKGNFKQDKRGDNRNSQNYNQQKGQYQPKQYKDKQYYDDQNEDLEDYDQEYQSEKKQYQKKVRFIDDKGKNQGVDIDVKEDENQNYEDNEDSNKRGQQRRGNTRGYRGGEGGGNRQVFDKQYRQRAQKDYYNKESHGQEQDSNYQREVINQEENEDSHRGGNQQKREGDKRQYNQYKGHGNKYSQNYSNQNDDAKNNKKYQQKNKPHQENIVDKEQKRTNTYEENEQKKQEPKKITQLQQIFLDYEKKLDPSKNEKKTKKSKNLFDNMNDSD